MPGGFTCEAQVNLIRFGGLRKGPKLSNETLEQQAEEAEKEASDLLHELSEQGNGEDLSEEYPAEVIWSSYLGSRFEWAFEQKLIKRLTYCNHSSLKSPQLLVLNVSKPNHVDCLKCGVRRSQRIQLQKPRKCDYCQAPSDQLQEIVMQAGVFLITGEICTPCSEEQNRSLEILSEQHKEVAKEQENAKDS